MNRFTCNGSGEPSRAMEEAGYLKLNAELVYYVIHRAPRPEALALLVGPFACDRPLSYALWVRWARHLASHGLTSMHFDYRGVGESTGAFEQFSFEDWCNDIQLCAARLQQEAPGLPLVLTGLGIGGLLGAQLFRQGLGDALLLWSPPVCGNSALKEFLVRRLSYDYALARLRGPKRLADYIACLDRGHSVNVEGYAIGPRLWHKSSSIKLGLEGAGGSDPSGREWKIVRLGAAEVPLIGGFGLWRALNPRSKITRYPLNPDLGLFFQQNLGWILNQVKRTWPMMVDS
ncbi:MAG TPA: alpha/beta hydrolase [Verrucomicrobiae bacterium]|nr:alpha/beta hydrolase [Verrucomicrobiae bacterium]